MATMATTTTTTTVASLARRVASLALFDGILLRVHIKSGVVIALETFASNPMAQERLNLGRGSKEDLCLCFAEPLQNILDAPQKG